jgi:hypothetical protein
MLCLSQCGSPLAQSSASPSSSGSSLEQSMVESPDWSTRHPPWSRSPALAWVCSPAHSLRSGFSASVTSMQTRDAVPCRPSSGHSSRSWFLTCLDFFSISRCAGHSFHRARNAATPSQRSSGSAHGVATKQRRRRPAKHLSRLRVPHREQSQDGCFQGIRQVSGLFPSSGRTRSRMERRTRRRLTCMTQRNGCLYSGSSRY